VSNVAPWAINIKYTSNVERGHLVGAID
jgi:hypothetical protein